MTNTLLNPPTKITPTQARANRALALPRVMFNRLLRSWAEGLDAVWGAPDPGAVLAAMGTQAGELFARSAQLRAFLEQQQAGSTNIPQAAKVKEVTVNGDGTVRLTGKL